MTVVSVASSIRDGLQPCRDRRSAFALLLRFCITEARREGKEEDKKEREQKEERGKENYVLEKRIFATRRTGLSCLP